MARHLTQLTIPIKSYLQARFGSGFSKKINLDNLNAPLKLAKLLGMAHFTTHFFNYLNTKNITDEESKLKVWQHITENSSALIQVVENSALPDFFSLNNEVSNYPDQCLVAYCICLWDMEAEGKPLAKQMVEKLVDHFLPSLFTGGKKKKPTTEEQKRKVAKLLTSSWQVKPMIKESFSIDEEVVTFSLTAKAPKHPPVTLITLTGSRLNNTRQKAYRQVLQQIAITPLALPKPNIPTKKSTMAPLE